MDAPAASHLKAAVPADAAVPGPFPSLIETTKPGITRLVTITSAVGFGLSWATHGHSRDLADLWLPLVSCLLGTAASAAGANAINQFMERDRDARMDRTRRRPLPQERLTPGSVFGFGLALSVIGIVILFLGSGPVPAAISLACIISYTVLYTPLKPASTLSTYVGTIPGALPPLIGWSAAATIGHGTATRQAGLDSLLEPGGWSLFALMTVWQLPHFFAIAWMYKGDYAKGGYKVLPVVDPSGNKTAWSIAIWTLLLVPVSLMPMWAMPELLRWPSATVAILGDAWFVWHAVRLIRTRTVVDARKVFFASIAWLPAVLCAMVIEAACRVLF